METMQDLYSKLKTIHKRIALLKKMQDHWGLSDENKRNLQMLSEEYIEVHYNLVDIVFIDQIEPFLYDDKIINLKSKMESKYNWSGELLIDDDYLMKTFEKITDKNEFLNEINELEKEELEKVKEFIKTDMGKEVEEAFNELILIKENNTLDSISQYITTRNNITKKLINTYFNFENFIDQIKLKLEFDKDENDE